MDQSSSSGNIICFFVVSHLFKQHEPGVWLYTGLIISHLFIPNVGVAKSVQSVGDQDESLLVAKIHMYTDMPAP